MILSGTVRDTAGTPIAAAQVFIAEGPGPFPDVAALTGDDGRFTFGVNLPGDYRLECHADGFVPVSVQVAGRSAEPSPVDIQLHREEEAGQRQSPSR